MDEIVHLDIQSQIDAIICRNKPFLNRSDLYPYSDVCRGEYYSSQRSSENRITLIIHCDGAPLVRSSKRSTWPLFASIVEIPPPIREHQRNIILLAIWTSRRKPNPNIFLHETIADLQCLFTNGVTIFVDGVECQVSISTQYFISDLPAKALFLRTISYNGYFACTHCLTKGKTLEFYRNQRPWSSSLSFSSRYEFLLPTEMIWH